MDDNETRTRISYDAVAERYAVEIAGELADKPLDRALLDCLVELSNNAGKKKPIGDVGCGPGHVAAYLAGRGAEVVGIDLSPGMVDADGLTGAGFDVRSRTVREPWPDIEHASRRAYLLACRTGVLR